MGNKIFAIGELRLQRESPVETVSDARRQTSEVFLELRDPIYRYLLNVLDDPEEAKDLTQEVFLRLYDYLQEGEALSNVRSWIFRVAHNLVINEQKKNGRLSSLDVAALDMQPDPTPDAEKRLLRLEQETRFQRALISLSVKEKHCLELRAEGLSYREIAEVLGMPQPTLVSFIGRIMKKLVRETHE
ncbi:MAG: RNA polymerase sigma factor [Acidobacteria bacterium]|nr:RNA polymerase sigma factor [Acidobacteriota bacterium]